MHELAWVKVEKIYVLEGPDSLVTLLDIFEGRRQLIVHHVAFESSWDEGLSSITDFANDFAYLPNLHEKNTSYAIVSRASQSKIEAIKQRLGWTIPWYSSFDSDFSNDFHEQSGISVFVRDGKCLYHTDSLVACGIEDLVSAINFSDLSPIGR